MEYSPAPSSRQLRENRFAMKLSLAVGFLLLAGKLTAYFLTGSLAIFSDAVESVVHQMGVLFAAFSLWLSVKPPDKRFPHGYERISFFSAGFEGALIMAAALTIIYTSVRQWIDGLELTNLGVGTWIIVGAGLLNLFLGMFLLRQGKKHRSLILEANGKHVLSDSWTSFGVVLGLVLVLLTGWRPFDPICAILVALNILWSGGKLVMTSIGGLMDRSDPEVGKLLREHLDAIEREFGVNYHHLRFRHTGYRLQVEFHLLFPYEMAVGKAHEVATQIERRLIQAMELPTEVVSHLEAVEDHSEVHAVKNQKVSLPKT